jgi:hypothetical protein
VDQALAAPKLRGRAILWWAAGSFIWILSIPLCLLLGHDLVSAPPPSLHTWVVVAEWLPVLAIGSSAVCGAVTISRGAPSIVGWINAGKGLLWCSIVIALIAAPKAP